MTNMVSVIIPRDLRERARDMRINISAVCRRALADEVELAEKTRGRGQVSGTGAQES